MRLLWALLLLPGPLWADPLVAAWRGWAPWLPARIAVLRAGEVTEAERWGGGEVILASVSKTLVGLCLARLAEAGKIDLGAPAAEYLGPIGPGAEASLGAFATHSAGLWPDATQGFSEAWWRQEAPQDAAVAAQALARPLEAPGFRYNNENYALLGWVIAEVVGRALPRACYDPPLALHKDWAAAGAFGGFTAPLPLVARAVADLAAFEPERLARAEAGGGADYALGLLTRVLPEGRVYWHMGQLCLNGEGGGAYVARYPDGTVVAASWEGCPSDARRARLDQALASAALAR